MPFTIPNEADAFNTNQAEPDKVDIDILVAGIKGNGVLSGCAVTAQGTPDMTVAVATGTVKVDGTVSSVASGNLTIGAADATNPRFDLIVVDSAGAKSVVAGTAVSNPVFPAVPASKICLAAVYVPANDTTINSNQITDKRVEVSGGFMLAVKTADEDVVSSTVLQDDDALVLTLLANTDYEIEAVIFSTHGSGNKLKYDFSFAGTVTGVSLLHEQVVGSSGITGGTTYSPKQLTTAISTTMVVTGSGTESNQRIDIAIKLEVGATGGAFRFRFAQDISNVDGTTVKAGSYILARS